MRKSENKGRKFDSSPPHQKMNKDIQILKQSIRSDLTQEKQKE